MARTTTACAAGGLLLGGLGALGWHFQPVFEALGPPRPAEQLLQALGARPPGSGPFYSGAISYEELDWWHDPSWITTSMLVTFGGLVGTVIGAVLSGGRRRAARTGSARAGSARRATPTPTPRAGLVLGLLVGGGSALAWHWDPEATRGPWNDRWFWPVDVLYPITGAALALAVAVVLDRRPRSSRG